MGCRVGNLNTDRLSRFILTVFVLRMSGWASSYSLGVSNKVIRKSSPRTRAIPMISPAVKPLQGPSE